VTLSVGKADDPNFIGLMNSLITGLMRSHAPEEFWIIEIDNWFDDKWLRFSGIGSVDFEFPSFMHKQDVALAEFRQDRATFPPFSPNRVLAQYSYTRANNSEYKKSALPNLPHPSKKQPSQLNLQRRIQDFTKSGIFFWYSGNTLANGRGSAMVYRVAGEIVECWFASFEGRVDWALSEAKGINREEVLAFINKT
jgi:hypothetical protein